jgi:hypothetical protein
MEGVEAGSPGRDRFRLARMSSGVRVMTFALLLLPVICLSTERSTGFRVACLVVAAYASVWLLFRPRWFVVGADGVRVEWPLRAQVIPFRELETVCVLPAAGYPRGMRVGSGGLWGTFGWIVGGQETVELYASRRTGLVVLRRKRRLPLLITPEDPERFVATVRTRCAA